MELKNKILKHLSYLKCFKNCFTMAVSTEFHYIMVCGEMNINLLSPKFWHVEILVWYDYSIPTICSNITNSVLLMVITCTVKILRNGTPKIIVIELNHFALRLLNATGLKWKSFFNIMGLQDADGVATSVNPDQTAHTGEG